MFRNLLPHRNFGSILILTSIQNQPTVAVFILKSNIVLFYHGATAPSGPRPTHCRGFMITLKHTTLVRTPLDERSTWRRSLNLKTHNIHNRQTSMPPAGFEPTIPASERQQTHALDRAATGIDPTLLGNLTNCYGRYVTSEFFAALFLGQKFIWSFAVSLLPPE